MKKDVRGRVAKAMHLGYVLVEEGDHDDRQGGEEQVVESLVPVIIEALPTEASVHVEPKLG